MKKLDKEKLKIQLKKITKTSLLFGIGFLFLWKWSLRHTFIPRPAEIFLFVALISGTVYLFLNKFEDIKRIPKIVLIAQFLLIFSTLFATLYGYIRYGLTFNSDGFLILYKLFTGIIIFLGYFIFIRGDECFFKRVYIAFWLPSIIFLPFLFLPQIAEKLSFLTADSKTFIGLAYDPHLEAAILFVAFTLLFATFMYSLLGNWRKKLVWLLVSLIFLYGFEALLIWNNTRSYIMALFLSVLLISAGIGIFFKKKPIWIFLIACISLFIVAIIPFSFPSYIFKPYSQKLEQISKISSNWSKSNIFFEGIKGEKKIGSRNMIIASSSVPGYDWRTFTTVYYFRIFKSNPFAFLIGTGVNYPKKFSLIYQYENENFQLGPGTILDMFLWGGVGAFLSLLIFVWLILKNVLQKIRSAFQEPFIYHFGCAVAVVGLLFASILTGSLFISYASIYFWILSAMALA